MPRHDKYMETTLPGVFVAGDGAGIAGAQVAVEEGRLTGIAASQQLGHISETEALNRSLPILTKLKGLRKFESTLGKISSVRKGLFDRITNDTIICRCEEITAGEIWGAVNSGARSLNEVKRYTRAGMGLCQGRMCEYTIAELISSSTNQSIESVGYFTPRPPVKPLPLDAFILMEVGTDTEG